MICLFSGLGNQWCPTPLELFIQVYSIGQQNFPAASSRFSNFLKYKVYILLGHLARLSLLPNPHGAYYPRGGPFHYHLLLLRRHSRRSKKLRKHKEGPTTAACFEIRFDTGDTDCGRAATGRCTRSGRRGDNRDSDKTNVGRRFERLPGKRRNARPRL
jgi:hypothetical protein